ncbi:MAG: sigma 54-dependent Fis family transcriptional regulator [Deltaproteobacteria bacterium]|nr:sigma 54-dependent Fis family transcriptional regulator [Deltaproteobacteria bacterium]
MESGVRTLQIAGVTIASSGPELFLEVVEGPDRGQEFGPLRPTVRVGSGQGNDVRLRDPTVSRFHFTIEVTADGLALIDTGSTNGTFLGGHRIRYAFLADAATIRAGQTTLKVELAEHVPAPTPSPKQELKGLVGSSPRMRALFATVERLAEADPPVLIEGETGTGKELIARALHAGRQAKAPFVVVDCGASAPTLIESELFGHRRGAFTGATEDRKGAFETAHHGSLFLDEVGELPLELQPKLLRALETSTIKPLGTQEERRVTTRIIAATHRNLRQMVNEGRFREDLYFRLAVFPISVPPLRERHEDLEPLALYFLRRSLRLQPFEGPQSLSPATLELLRGHDWPGNVRELRNLVERAVVLGDVNECRGGHLEPSIRTLSALERRSEASLSLEEAKDEFERDYLLRVLAKHADDVVAAAAEAQIHPKSLTRLLRRHGLKRS